MDTNDLLVYIKEFIGEKRFLEFQKLFWLGIISQEALFVCVRWIHKYKNIDPDLINDVINETDIFSKQCAEKKISNPDQTIRAIRLAENIIIGSCAYIIEANGQRQYFIDGFPSSRKNYLKAKKLRKKLVYKN